MSKAEQDFIRYAETQNRLANAILKGATKDPQGDEFGAGLINGLFDILAHPKKADAILKRIKKEVIKEYK